MMADIRRPNITAPTVDGQLSQVKSYLYQLTNELNFALKAAEEKNGAGNSENAGGSAFKSDENGASMDEAESTFLEVKNLIIKSADIVNAYYDIIEHKLSGIYVAQSDFGVYKEETEATITQTSEKAEATYNSLQSILDEDGNLSEIRSNEFYIRTGWLYDTEDGQRVGGIELGQVNTADDGTSQSAFARFTPEELAFFSDSGIKLASFSNLKLNIYEANIDGNLELGEYMLDTKNGIAFKWIGD